MSVRSVVATDVIFGPAIDNAVILNTSIRTIVRATQVHPTPALPSNPPTSTTSPPPSPNGDSNFFQNLARPALVLLMATFALIAFVIGAAIYMRLLRNHRRQQFQPALPEEAPFPEKTRPGMYTAMLQPMKHTQNDKWQKIMPISAGFGRAQEDDRLVSYSGTRRVLDNIRPHSKRLRRRATSDNSGHLAADTRNIIEEELRRPNPCPILVNIAALVVMPQSPEEHSLLPAEMSIGLSDAWLADPRASFRRLVPRTGVYMFSKTSLVMRVLAKTCTLDHKVRKPTPESPNTLSSTRPPNIGDVSSPSPQGDRSPDRSHPQARYTIVVRLLSFEAARIGS
ncbi:hypothetical protein BC629DRAFT_1437698 [Irpex lacteus]|nr:hypothetical protein BC629DRAFT_1437698 [Irpex lacteus]